jgi:hypothetical protein
MTHTLREIADILIRSVTGGVNSPDTKYEMEYIEALVPQLREEAMQMEYNGSKEQAANGRVEYGWLNPQFTVPVDASLQDPDLDFLIFALPRPVAINKSIDGIIYLGEKNKSKSFKKMTSREDVSNAMERGFFTNGKDIGYIWQMPYVEVYGNKSLKEINVRMIAADPTQCPGFDVDNDEYPITASLLLTMTNLFKALMNVNIQKPADNITDSVDTTSRAVLSQNTKG